ncbi:MAG: adenylate kinase [Bacteroidales bacterium]|nr:adenylate kinase [Bacteroidales bacterium]
MKYYIMFGPPGAGKGTQAALMVEKYNFRHVSTGDLLRHEIQAQTELGKLAASLIEKGELVPDEVVEGMIKGEIETHPDVKGFIFDGFPRTVAQAEALDKMLEELGESITAVISIAIDDTMVRDRIRHRAMIEDRKDDMDDATITTRILTYHKKTEPLIAYYKESGKYHEIYGVGSIKNIFTRICKLVDSTLKD